MPDDTPTLIVAGDVGLDIVTRPQGALRWGDDTPANVELLPGGQGANVATWARRAGVEVHLYTQLGRDPVGRMLHAALSSRGIAVHARRTERSTRVVSLVEGGTRTLVADLGDGSWSSLPPRPASKRALADALYISGYILNRPGGEAWLSHALRWAERAGVPVAVTPSAVSVLERAEPDARARLFARAWAVVLNANEAETLTALQDPVAATRRLGERHKHVMVTAGARGAWVYADGDAVHVPAAPLAAPIVDTTGAGDAAAGTYLASLVRGMEPVRAGTFALAAAAVAVTRPGAWANPADL